MSPRTQSMGLAILELCLILTGASFAGHPRPLFAQAPVAARATPQRGTVKSIEGNSLTIATDAGQQVAVIVSPSTRIQRLAAGSTDLKTAETAALSDIALGDRVLISGVAGETPATFNAARVILMKSGDIAQRHEAEQGDWKKRGTSGVVSAVDTSSGALTVSSGARKLQIVTTSTTSFRRYADGSVKFEDAKPGTLAQIRTGDQLLARGAKSDDGNSVQAEEVVSGSFKNLSGTILSVDAGKNTVTLKDLVTKRTLTVQLTANSALHRLPPGDAARLVSHARAGSSSGAASSGPAPAGAASARPDPRPNSRPDRRPDGQIDRPTAAGDPSAGSGHSGAPDLSQIVARLPPVTLSDLHTGDAVMIVAEQSSTDASSLTAITLLAGVEPILAAAPSGSPAMTLSPWSIGGGSPDAGSSQ